LEQEIAGELSTLTARLSDAEKHSGDRALQARKSNDDKEVQKINDELSDLNAQHRVLSKTHEAAKLAVKQARHDIDRARGRDLRAQAAALTDRADERMKKTDKLLAELYKHEGIFYVPQPQMHESGVIIPNSYAVSETMKIRINAEALIRQAVTTENQVRNFEPRSPTSGRKSSAVSPDAAGHYPTT
jgi:outer membrane murein-binding lipoprotein Lpp